MKVVLIRHGKVDFDWNKWSTSEQFVKILLENKESCFVITHGFFLHTLIDRMKKNKFTINHTKLSYGNGECIIADR